MPTPEKDAIILCLINLSVFTLVVLLLTSVLSLHLINFLIPKIPKTDLGSSQIVESDGTLGIAKTNNVPHFYTHFIIQKFLLLLQGCLCGVEVSGSNPGQAKIFIFYL